MPEAAIASCIATPPQVDELLSIIEENVEMNTYNVEIKEEGSAQRVIRNPFGKAILLILIILGVGISIFQIFNISIMGKTMFPRAYYALLIGCFLPVTFCLYPHRKGTKDVQWFDVVASIV